MPIKVLSVFGTRPDAIKMCPLVKRLGGDSRFQSVVCVSAQHREMLDQVLEIFDVHPDYDLNIMKPSQTLFQVSAAMIPGFGDVFEEVQPDVVLVHGDTSTAFFAALAAFYKQIPVGHVEAGLRTGNIYSPFPEEMNRMLVGRLASLHFAPTTPQSGKSVAGKCARANFRHGQYGDRRHAIHHSLGLPLRRSRARVSAG